MKRTQVYLKERELGKLKELGLRLGKKQSELIRDAIELLIKSLSDTHRGQILSRFAGAWKNHDEFDLSGQRAGWDRPIS